MVEELWTCGSCGVEAERVEPGDTPEGWVRVEDAEYIDEYCSMSCAAAAMLHRSGEARPRP